MSLVKSSIYRHGQLRNPNSRREKRRRLVCFEEHHGESAKKQRSAMNKRNMFNFAECLRLGCRVCVDRRVKASSPTERKTGYQTNVNHSVIRGVHFVYDVKKQIANVLVTRQSTSSMKVPPSANCTTMLGEPQKLGPQMWARMSPKVPFESRLPPQQAPLHLRSDLTIGRHLSISICQKTLRRKVALPAGQVRALQTSKDQLLWPSSRQVAIRHSSFHRLSALSYHQVRTNTLQVYIVTAIGCPRWLFAQKFHRLSYGLSGPSLSRTLDSRCKTSTLFKTLETCTGKPFSSSIMHYRIQ